jgi:hypothetical protein
MYVYIIVTSSWYILPRYVYYVLKTIYVKPKICI